MVIMVAMQWITLLLLFLPGSYGIMEEYGVQLCSIGGNLQNMNSGPSLTGRIIFDYTALCDGTIASWEIYAKDVGTVTLTVWRINHNTDEMYMAGYNTVEVTVTGYQELQIPVIERIRVYPGDAIGYMYDSTSTKPILTHESADAARTSPKQLCRGMSLGDQNLDEVIDARKTMATEFDYLLAPIRAVVMGPSPNIRLADGPTYNEGIVQIYKAETWGTVCDKWFQEYGWPMLFCLEAGFPFGWDVSAVWKTGSADLPIHMHSPRCKTSQNMTIFSCDAHPRGDCTHDEDVYITCPKRLEFVPLIFGRGPNEGIAYMFNNGFWGTVCDTKTPDDHNADLSISWTLAFCMELGFPGVDSISYVKSINPGYTTSDPPSRKNPVCDTSFPSDMTFCPADLHGSKCGPAENYYIVCTPKAD